MNIIISKNYVELSEKAARIISKENNSACIGSE